MKIEKANMNPFDYAKPDCSEHAEQVAFFMAMHWASLYGMNAAMDRMAYGNVEKSQSYNEQPLPQLNAAFAIGNGGSRGDTDLSRKIAGGKMKAEGVKPGVPDVCVPIPVGKYAGLFIEFKRLNGSLSDVSEDQRSWIDNLSSVGYRVDVCFGWINGMKTIREYFGI